MSEENSFVEQTTADVTPESSPVVEPAQAVEGEEVEGLDTESAEITEQPVAGTGAERRIKQLAAQRKAEQEARIKAEREAAYYRGLSEARGGETPKPQATQPQEVQPVAPEFDQFETLEEYDRAKDEYLVQLAEYRIAKRYVEHQKQQAEQAIQQQFTQRIDEAAAADPSFRDILNDPTLPVSKDMVQVLQHSELSPQILKWIHNNRAEAQKIMRMPLVLAAKELGAIEARIKATPKPEPPKRVSAAPEPIQALTPASPAVVDDEDLPMEEYYRRRTKQMYGRG